jgi:hypothetical protein
MAKVRVLFKFVFMFMLFISYGCGTNNEIIDNEAVIKNQSEITASSYIERSKQIVLKYKLTQLSFECLTFENTGKDQKFKAIIDVREQHNEKCQGDIKTSPRLFSIAFDKNDKVWSDAKSILSQMEPLE